MFVSVIFVLLENEDLFGCVQEVLSQYFYDLEVRECILVLIDEVCWDFELGMSEVCQCDVVFGVFEQMEILYFGLFLKLMYKCMFDEFWCWFYLIVGFEFLEVEGDYYVINVFEGGLVDFVGLFEGVCVLMLLGMSFWESGLLDFCIDDVVLFDLLQYYVLVGDGDCVMVDFEELEVGQLVVEVCVQEYLVFEVF